MTRSTKPHVSFANQQILADNKPSQAGGQNLLDLMDNTPAVEQKIEPISRPIDLINDGGLLDLIDTPVQQQQAPYIPPTMPVQNFSTSVPSYNNNNVQQ